MKHIAKIFVFIVLLTGNYCSSQKIVQTVDDLQKIKVNNQNFNGKPLKSLLKEISPTIKTFLLKPGATPGAGVTEEIGNISFAFVDPTEYFEKVSKGHRPITILVYLNEKIEDNKGNSKGMKFNWTKDDQIKYENFTIAGIRVYGEN